MFTTIKRVVKKQFCNFLKMSNNAPLTIENLELENFRAKTPESKKSGVFTYFAIPFEYDEGIQLLRLTLFPMAF